MAVQSDCLHVATSSSARYGRAVCLPFDNGALDQSRDRRDGHKAGSVMPTHDHLVVHLIENGAVEPYSLLRYRAGSDGCR